MADQWKSPASEDEMEPRVDSDTDELRGRADEGEDDFEEEDDLLDEEEEDEEGTTF